MEQLTLGPLLRERRKEMGLSIKSISKKLDICPAEWSRYENNRNKWPLSLSLLKKINKLMDIDLEILKGAEAK